MLVIEQHPLLWCCQSDMSKNGWKMSSICLNSVAWSLTELCGLIGIFIQFCFSKVISELEGGIIQLAWSAAARVLTSKHLVT